MINVKFRVDDPNVHPAHHTEFSADCHHVPRIGETVVRHTEGGMALEGRYIVADVVTVIETRDWYVSRGMCDPVIVVLKHKEQ